MILASIKSSVPGLRLDGEMVLVHPDRSLLALLPKPAFSSLREALDDWSSASAELRQIDSAVRSGRWKETRPLSSARFTAPLPRTWALLDGSAFVQHVKLVRRARGAEPPEDLLTAPLMYQGASDNLLGANDEIPLRDPTDGMDFESEVVIVTDSVPMGTKASQAPKHIILVMLMNDISLRELIPREMATGFGFLHGKPPSTFSPFALTPDELGEEWSDGRLNLPVKTTLNGETFGNPNAGEMHFSFPQLIEYAATTRPLSAGTIIGSGTVSNENEAAGSSCLVERRMLEKIKTGAIKTQYLKDGDSIEVSVVHNGVNLFGSISQRVRKAAST